MLCSLVADSIAIKVQCNECLYRVGIVSVERENENVTLLCCRALAIWCAPWSPILLFIRSSVVSVYVKL